MELQKITPKLRQSYRALQSQYLPRLQELQKRAESEQDVNLLQEIGNLNDEFTLAICSLVAIMPDVPREDLDFEEVENTVSNFRRKVPL